MSKDATDEAVIIKKYANRRLYNTETSVYVTLEDLCQMVKDDTDFVVQDAKSGEDLTRQTLTQIIFEQEAKGMNLLPTTFLRNVIRFYDDKMGEVLHHYLGNSMDTFLENQDKMRSYMGKAIQGIGTHTSPMSQLEEMTRSNVAFMEKAFSMFSPFGSYGDDKNKKKK